MGVTGEREREEARRRFAEAHRYMYLAFYLGTFLFN